jgi:hypothetical protein
MMGIFFNTGERCGLSYFNPSLKGLNLSRKITYVFFEEENKIFLWCVTRELIAGSLRVLLDWQSFEQTVGDKTFPWRIGWLEYIQQFKNAVE